jgi:hypothetical protein
MKLTPIIFGLWLATGATLLAGAPGGDVRISGSTHEDSPSASDKGRDSAPDFPVIGGGRRGRLEDTVEILGVTEQKPEASGRRKVTVRVRYVLVHYPKGVLTLGFNLKSATTFVQVTNQPVMAGSEAVELSATIVPVTWPKPQPFKFYVGLSAEPHPGQWSLLAAVAQVMKPIATPVAARGGS